MVTAVKWAGAYTRVIMEIRSITLFCDPDRDPATLAPFLAAARGAFPARVQSLRLGATPFPDWLPRDRAAAAAADFAAAWRAAGANYVSLGPVLLRHDPSWLDIIPGLLTAADGLFASVEIATPDGRLDVGRCHATARLVRRVSTLHADGFGNLFLGALAGCGPGHPFLPASYHSGGAPSFAVAVEAADVALAAVAGATTLDEARARLVAAIEDTAAAIAPTAERLAAEFGLRFGGIDLSPAPYPTADKSLGAALEALGARVGAPGALFAAAFITEALDRARFPRAGFCGLMLPVLEDATLARRAAAGQLALSDLLLYSAVCGVGLDTVPLPGDVDEAMLAGILLDTAALSARLRKPLVARLMPLPGMRAGEATAFGFEYFAPGGVMDVAGEGVSGLLVGGNTLDLAAYRARANGL
jgi:uncharacterized protein (UPF0210 family)